MPKQPQVESSQGSEDGCHVKTIHCSTVQVTGVTVASGSELAFHFRFRAKQVLMSNQKRELG